MIGRSMKNFTDVNGRCLTQAKRWLIIVDFIWYDSKWEYITDMDDVAIIIKNDNR